MECYEKVYPEKPVTCIMVGKSSEFKEICVMVTDYMAHTRKNKSIDKYISMFEEASLYTVPLVILSQKEGGKFYEYIKNYAGIKKRIKNHKVHKLLDVLEHGLVLW